MIPKSGNRFSDQIMPGMEPIDIVRLRPDNASLLDRVAVDVFDEQVAPERLAAYVAEPGHMMLVAVVDGVVVGRCAAVIHRHPDKVAELYIDEVGVTPAFHRQGIARRMLDAMFALGRERGCGEAWVGTDRDDIVVERGGIERGGRLLGHPFSVPAGRPIGRRSGHPASQSVIAWFSSGGIVPLSIMAPKSASLSLSRTQSASTPSGTRKDRRNEPKWRSDRW